MTWLGWILLILVGAFFVYELITLIRDLKNKRKSKKVNNMSDSAQSDTNKIRR